MHLIPKIFMNPDLSRINKNYPADDHLFIPPIITALILGFLPHIFLLPPVITVWCFVCWGYLLLAVIKKFPRPKPVITFIAFVLAIVVVLFASGRTIAGHTYISLLAVMSSLKPYEIKSHRDRMITVFISFFLIIAALFETESLFITLYMFPAVIFSTAVIIRLNHPQGTMGGHLRLSIRMMLQALPLMLLCFFIFPRLESNALWETSLGLRNRSGFNDRFSVGNISRIVKNREIAFRAVFDNQLPEKNKLYWRGIVFLMFDGYTWRRGARIERSAPPIKGRTHYDYTISLLPHHQKWLFALDLPASTTSKALILSDHTLYSTRRIDRLLRYQVRSIINGQTETQQPYPRAALQLPRQQNPRATALARKWLSENNEPTRIVEAAIDFYSGQPFTYTLNPPAASHKSVDAFLFDTQKGYCEHFASSFAFLMRAAGIPTRLVGGYLGGEYNPVGNYIIVRQADAHVWAEVWMKNRGWIRIDPTVAAFPKRLQNIQDVLSDVDLPDYLKKSRYTGISEFFKQIRFGLDTLNVMWDIWFSGFSMDDQKALLKKLGIEAVTWELQVLALIVALGLVIAVNFYYSYRIDRHRRFKNDIVQKYYRMFCDKMRMIGIERPFSMGPVDFGNKIIQARKDLEPQVREIILLYIKIRYYKDDQHSRDALIRKIKRFKPSRHIAVRN